MKKIVLLFTVLVLFAGCKHRKAIRVEDETPQNSEESFVLHPTIMAAIKESMQFILPIRMTDLPC